MTKFDFITQNVSFGRSLSNESTQQGVADYYPLSLTFYGYVIIFKIKTLFNIEFWF